MNTVTMNATVLSVQAADLLVCDHGTSQKVVVHTANAPCFRPGDCICIHYNGMMTRSLPPQITAALITRRPCCDA